MHRKPAPRREVEALGIVEESERFEIEARARESRGVLPVEEEDYRIEENGSTTIKNQPKRSTRFSDSGKFARRLRKRFTRLAARLVRAHSAAWAKTKVRFDMKAAKNFQVLRGFPVSGIVRGSSVTNLSPPSLSGYCTASSAFTAFHNLRLTIYYLPSHAF